MSQATIQFFQKLLKKLYISSCVLTDAANHIPSGVDLGLRAELFGMDNYAPFLENSISQANSRTIYRFFDEYDCHYIFLQLSEKDQSYLFVGPYLLTLPEKERTGRRKKLLGLTPEKADFIEQYYSSLPYIEDENLLLTMTNALAAQLWGEEQAYTLEYVEYAIPDHHKPIPASTLTTSGKDSLRDLKTLEKDYAHEKILMDAVSKGKLHIVTTVASSLANYSGDPRLSDSLRDRKNNLIILKTLLRKAAEYGGVHPLHIHQLSSHFADRIESIRTIKQSFALQEEMIRSYCLLVKNHSLKQYSYFVGQVITLVQYDLTADLRLKTIADQLNVNASYLSALFHKEYGCTLTEFINKERIDHGIHLLQRTEKPVQNIAAECGIQDTAYFIKLFKKQTGMTPNQYRDKVRS